MRIFKILIFAILTFVIGQMAFAINLNLKNPLKKGDGQPTDYNAWADTADIVRNLDGLEVVYPVSTPNGAEINGSIALSSHSTESQVIAAIMLNFRNNCNPATDSIVACDFINGNLILSKTTVTGSKNTETGITRTEEYSLDGDSLYYTIKDVVINYKEKGIIPRKLALEKLNPKPKTRHFELVENLAFGIAREMDELKRFCEANPSLEIKNPDLMALRIPAEGMTELEVTLLLGKPPVKRKSGERFRWVYDDGRVIIFTDGVVSKVI